MIIKVPISHSLSRVITAWNLKYSFNVANALRCIHDIASKELSYRGILDLIEEAHESINNEIVDLDMGFDYSVNINGNPQEQLFTPTLKGERELNLFYNPYMVFIAWFPDRPEDFSLLEINMILYLIRVYSEIFKWGESEISYTSNGGTKFFLEQERAKKLRTTLMDILGELNNFMNRDEDLFIKMEKMLYKRGRK